MDIDREVHPKTFLARNSKDLCIEVLSNGRTAGSEVDVNPGGHIDCTFEFNDRGRGPRSQPIT
jgi:hypothetical protein